MDIIAAYREVGSYRGAAAICGTTPKTVKRVDRPPRVRRRAAGARSRGGTTTTRSPSWSPSGWSSSKGRITREAAAAGRAGGGL